MFESECQMFMSKRGNLKSTPKLKLSTQTHAFEVVGKDTIPEKLYKYSIKALFETYKPYPPGGILVTWYAGKVSTNRVLPPRPGQFETLFALLGVSPDSQCGLLALWLGQLREFWHGFTDKTRSLFGGCIQMRPKFKGL